MGCTAGIRPLQRRSRRIPGWNFTHPARSTKYRCQGMRRHPIPCSQKVQTTNAIPRENFNHSYVLVLIQFVNTPTGKGTTGRSTKGRNVILDEFRRRADECRRLAAAARNASDRAFWMGLVERWQALESQTAERPRREKPKSRRHAELSAAGDFD
jgi:hypothetical protein